MALDTIDHVVIDIFSAGGGCGEVDGVRGEFFTEGLGVG